MEGCAVTIIGDMEVCPHTEENLHSVCRSPVSSLVNGCTPQLARFCIYICPPGNQKLCYFCMVTQVAVIWDHGTVEGGHVLFSPLIYVPPPSTRASVVSLCPEATAWWSAKSPSAAFALTSAPWVRRETVIAVRPLLPAKWSGLNPFSVSAFGSAPLDRRSLPISRRSLRHATIKAKLPENPPTESDPLTSNLAPASANISTAPMCPADTARINAVSPSCRPSKSAPTNKRRRRSSSFPPAIKASGAVRSISGVSDGVEGTDHLPNARREEG
mmetsp:Transcript_18660/g.37760  ORF Transcript_18660/g.37760 Transcript_18660/m.37760 type:complete len:272 (-) Transcript_18660:784-1599(-)